MWGYSFRTILRQSSQRLSVNRWPRSGTEPHTRQTHPSARQRFAHASSFLRSESSVLTTCESTSERGRSLEWRTQRYRPMARRCTSSSKTRNGILQLNTTWKNSLETCVSDGGDLEESHLIK